MESRSRVSPPVPPRASSTMALAAAPAPAMPAGCGIGTATTIRLSFSQPGAKAVGGQGSDGLRLGPLGHTLAALQQTDDEVGVVPADGNGNGVGRLCSGSKRRDVDAIAVDGRTAPPQRQVCATRNDDHVSTKRPRTDGPDDSDDCRWALEFILDHLAAQAPLPEGVPVTRTTTNDTAPVCHAGWSAAHQLSTAAGSVLARSAAVSQEGAGLGANIPSGKVAAAALNPAAGPYPTAAAVETTKSTAIATIAVAAAIAAHDAFTAANGTPSDSSDGCDHVEGSEEDARREEEAPGGHRLIDVHASQLPSVVHFIRQAGAQGCHVPLVLIQPREEDGAFHPSLPPSPPPPGVIRKLLQLPDGRVVAGEEVLAAPAARLAEALSSIVTVVPGSSGAVVAADRGATQLEPVHVPHVLAAAVGHEPAYTAALPLLGPPLAAAVEQGQRQPQQPQRPLQWPRAQVQALSEQALLALQLSSLARPLPYRQAVAAAMATPGTPSAPHSNAAATTQPGDSSAAGDRCWNAGSGPLTFAGPRQQQVVGFGSKFEDSFVHALPVSRSGAASQSGGGVPGADPFGAAQQARRAVGPETPRRVLAPAGSAATPVELPAPLRMLPPYQSSGAHLMSTRGVPAAEGGTHIRLLFPLE